LATPHGALLNWYRTLPQVWQTPWFRLFRDRRGIRTA
jgi:hypothetical protein